jgi:hypothetical protein
MDSNEDDADTPHIRLLRALHGDSLGIPPDGSGPRHATVCGVAKLRDKMFEHRDASRVLRHRPSLLGGSSDGRVSITLVGAPAK